MMRNIRDSIVAILSAVICTIIYWCSMVVNRLKDRLLLFFLPDIPSKWYSEALWQYRLDRLLGVHRPYRDYLGETANRRTSGMEGCLILLLVVAALVFVGSAAYMLIV